MSSWGIGGTIIIYLASLQNMPQALVDAVRVDGANALGVFRYVILPAMSPIILFTAVLALIGSFQVFIPAYILTSGGPVNSTYFLVLYIYQEAFDYLNVGYANALAWVLMIIVMFITLAQFRLSRRWVYYAGSDDR
jgi:multiple sugar transport system permease protein